MVPNELVRCRVATLSARLHEGNALLVVHDVQRLAHERVRSVLAIDLKATQVNAFVLDLTCGQFSDLAYPLSGGVINVPSTLAEVLRSVGISGIHRLALS